MLRHPQLLCVLVAALVGGLLLGCERDSGGGSSQVGPAIGGSWAGVYYETDNPGGTIALTATVTHDGDAVTIQTSKSGIGALLTGTIDQDGDLVLTDAFDSETWSTFYGPATASKLVVADYLWNTNLGSLSPLAVIDLER